MVTCSNHSSINIEMYTHLLTKINTWEQRDIFDDYYPKYSPPDTYYVP